LVFFRFRFWCCIAHVPVSPFCLGISRPSLSSSLFPQATRGRFGHPDRYWLGTFQPYLWLPLFCPPPSFDRFFLGLFLAHSSSPTLRPRATMIPPNGSRYFFLNQAQSIFFPPVLLPDSVCCTCSFCVVFGFLFFVFFLFFIPCNRDEASGRSYLNQRAPLTSRSSGFYHKYENSFPVVSPVRCACTCRPLIPFSFCVVRCPVLSLLTRSFFLSLFSGLLYYIRISIVPAGKILSL